MLDNISAAITIQGMKVLTALLLPEAVAGRHHSCSKGRTTGLRRIVPV